MRSPRAYRHALTALLTAATALAVVFCTAASADAGSRGVDVSSWNHDRPLSWSRVKADGNRFAFIKATEGTGYVNPYFHRDWASTHRVGLFHGAYHFARPHRGNARDQAHFFVRVAGRMRRHGTLPPVLDLEVTGGLRPAALRQWTRTWLETVHRATGRKPIVYTYPLFWRHALGNTRALSSYPLWIAHYGVRHPDVPGGWRTWTFWQGTSSARVSGIGGRVDSNVFHGSLSRLRRFAHAAGVRSPVTHAHRHDGRAATRTSIHLSATHVRPGGRVRLTGRLVTAQGRRLSGMRVSLLRRTGSGWDRVRMTRVGPRGRFSTSVRPHVSARYQARFHGGLRYRGSAATSRLVHVRHEVGTKVSLGTGRSVLRRGERVRLYGHLTTDSGRPLAGRTLRVIRKPARTSRWSRVTTVSSVSPTGWFQTYVRPRRNQVYRAVFPGAGRYRQGGSVRVWLRVR